ncbi:MAG: hypothetical protein AAGA20_14625 [Planctomycetota bacterium]
MRVLLGLVLALAAILAAFLFATRTAPAPEEDRVVVRDASARQEEDRTGAELSATSVERTIAEAEDPAPFVPVRDPALDVAREVLGRLVAGEDGAPLWDYSIHLVPSGARPRGVVPAGSELTTGPDGRFHADELDHRGPWDVYAWPFAPDSEALEVSPRARVGVAIAHPVGEGDEQTYRVVAGPTVVILSPLPAGVETSEVIVEARGRESALANGRGRMGGFGRVRETADGVLLAQIPNVTNVVQDKRFGVRAVTRDGLWSVAEVEEGRLRNGARAEVEGAFEQRGRVRFRIDVTGARDELEGSDALDCIGWTLPFGDPARDELDLPMSMRTTDQARRPIAIGDGLFELSDLPIGPLEFHTRGDSDAPEGRRFRLSAPVQATAVHGEAPPMVLVVAREG